MSTDLLLSVELRYLAYVVFLCLVLWIPYVLSAIITRGLGPVAGYPTGTYDDLPDWAQRSQRAHQNLVENLAPFAALVLIAHVSGKLGDLTELAVQLFFWARIAHAVVHIAGIPWLRTLAFTVGWIGNLMIFWQIVV